MNKTSDNFRENMEILKEGKIPESNTSVRNTSYISKSFKVTPEQNELLNNEVKKSGASFSDYIRNKLFDSTSIFALERGNEILAKLAECVDLLSYKKDCAYDDSKAILMNVQGLLNKVEGDISFILDYINTFKKSLNNEKERE